MKKISLILLLITMSISNGLLAGNENLDLPIQIKGKTAKILFEKLGRQNDIYVNRVGSGPDEKNFWITYQIYHADGNLVCFKIEEGFPTISVDYMCSTRIKLESLLPLLNLEQ